MENKTIFVRMSNKIKSFCFLVLVVCGAACVYEDGPKFSLRTKKARAVNTWFMDKAYEAGSDKTEAYKTAYVNYKLELKPDDNYNLSYRLYNLLNYTETGTWLFSDDKRYLVFKPSGTTQENRIRILRLKQHEARVELTIDNKLVELWLKD